MPLNYSKWDALEISDDSDVECHPNVDKQSFIRLKQRQIHQQRQDRKDKIDQLKHEATLNAALLLKMGDLVGLTGKDGANGLRQAASQLSAEGHAAQPSPDKQPTIEQMVFNLITQILSKITGQPDEDAAAKKELDFHLNRLTEREEKRKAELVKEEAEAKKHITSEDVHDGFDVSYVDKKPSVAIDEPLVAPAKSKIKSTKTTSIEVLNPKSAGIDAAEPDSSDDEELPKLSPSALKFARIRSSDYSSSLSAIQADPNLYLEEKTTDALLVEAFDSELEGKKAYAKNCVHQGLLLQYCRKLGRDGVRLFFQKVGSGDPRAMQVFIDDVNSTYERIAGRCATIIAEREQHPAGKEQIQLVPTDAATSITFEVPDGPPPEQLQVKTEDPSEEGQVDVEEVRSYLLDRWHTFCGFPDALQKALQTKQLECVNQALGNMQIAEAEKVVQDLDRVGILSFSERGIIDRTGANQEKHEDSQQQSTSGTTGDPEPVAQVEIPSDLSS